jgi:peptide chain release factor 1
LSSRNESDFKIEWYSGTGAGGQHRNKHQNSCRLIHLPTGIIETASCRSRENSLNEAKTRILETLDRRSKDHHAEIVSRDRKKQVGSGMRGDKVRTYRFQDNTVTDHITGRTAPCDKVMKGGIDLMWN